MSDILRLKLKLYAAIVRKGSKATERELEIAWCISMDKAVKKHFDKHGGF